MPIQLICLLLVGMYCLFLSSVLFCSFEIAGLTAIIDMTTGNASFFRQSVYHLLFLISMTYFNLKDRMILNNPS